jgi:hypothetical protein
MEVEEQYSWSLYVIESRIYLNLNKNCEKRLHICIVTNNTHTQISESYYYVVDQLENPYHDSCEPMDLHTPREIAFSTCASWKNGEGQQ